MELLTIKYYKFTLDAEIALESTLTLLEENIFEQNGWNIDYWTHEIKKVLNRNVGNE